jgi:uncharacterized protein YciI
MRTLFIFLVLISTSLLSAKAQEKKSTKDSFEMKTYYLVFLKKGTNRSQDSATAAKIQEAHLAHLAKMNDEKKMCIAGPLLDDSEIRGICIYSVESIEEARRLAEQDPAVKAGRLIVEVHPWYAAKGSVLP